MQGASDRQAYRLTYDDDTVIAPLMRSTYEGYVREEWYAQSKVYAEFRHRILPDRRLPDFAETMRATDGVFPIVVMPLWGAFGFD